MRKRSKQVSQLTSSGSKIDFEALFVESPDAIGIADSSGRFKYVNPAAERMFGYGMSELKDVQNTIALIAPDPSIHDSIVASLTRGIEADIVTPPVILRARNRNGQELLCRFQLYQLASGDIVIYAQDVTGSRLVEGHLKTIIDQAPIAMAIVGMDGTIEYINKKAITMCGYVLQDVPTMQEWWLHAYPDRKYREESIATWMTRLDKAIKDNHEIEGGEYRVTCKDGSVKTLLIFGVPVAGKVCVMSLDVSQRKEALQSFRYLAEQSPNMIFINQAGRVVYANIKCEETMGYSRSEICSPDFNFMDLVAPECHALTERAFRMHMAGKEAPSYEYSIVTKDKKRIPAVISTKLIVHEGRPAILGIVTDVSAMKQAEVDLKTAAATLRQQKKALEEKNTALKEVLTQIEGEKLEIKRQVSANAKKLIVPMVEKMRQRASASDRLQFDLLVRSIEDLTSRFGVSLSGGPSSLSARETEICAMVRNGMSSKEIAESLKISLRTVDTLRNRIRKKLGVTNKEVNLCAHLQTLA